MGINWHYSSLFCMQKKKLFMRMHLTMTNWRSCYHHEGSLHVDWVSCHAAVFCDRGLWTASMVPEWEDPDSCLKLTRERIVPFDFPYGAFHNMFHLVIFFIVYVVCISYTSYLIPIPFFSHSQFCFVYMLYYLLFNVYGLSSFSGNSGVHKELLWLCLY